MREASYLRQNLPVTNSMIKLISLKQRAYADIEARYVCAHEQRELRERTIVDGRQTFVTQCVRCGHASHPIGRTKVQAFSTGARTPAYDGALEDRWRAQKSQEYQEVFKNLGPSLEAEYEAYLRSAVWRERRNAILARASGRCELCEISDAVQVHHLTYIRLGSELLTDLLAVCANCHESLHAPTTD